MADETLTHTMDLHGSLANVGRPGLDLHDLPRADLPGERCEIFSSVNILAKIELP